MAYDMKDYVDVATRIQKFHEKYPDGSLQSEWSIHAQDGGKQVIVVKAYAYRTADDQRPGIGHAMEPVPGLTSFTKNSELMVGETSAWGRALAALGFEVRQGIASREEVMNRRDVDGGGTDSEQGDVDPGAAPVGFASEKQKGFFARKLKDGGLDSNQVEGVMRFAENDLSPARVSKALDGLKSKDQVERDTVIEALLIQSVKWAATQSDVPYDDSQ